MDQTTCIRRGDFQCTESEDFGNQNLISDEKNLRTSFEWFSMGCDLPDSRAISWRRQSRQLGGPSTSAGVAAAVKQGGTPYRS